MHCPMPRPHERWKVLPHGDLWEIDEGILTVVGEIRMPLGPLPRRMTIVRLAEAQLIVWSAIALDDPAMQRIEAFGRPAWLVVPNAHHRLDAKVWKMRYPQMKVVAPSGARAKVQEVVRVDSTTPSFDDPRVSFMDVPGTMAREAALFVRNPGGTTLVLNDLVGNIRHARGIAGALLRVAGFAGEAPKIPSVVKWAMIDDTAALRDWLLQCAE